MNLEWSSWYPLAGAGRDKRIPGLPGLYRIRRIGREQLDYIGQTGSLRGRLGQLGGIYRDDMPYNDPHTAGPGLWALRVEGSCEFEASVVVLDGDVVDRKAAECVAISQYRVESGASPTLNFGRMPAGWTKSSGNNAQLVARGRRFRGARDIGRERVSDLPAPDALTCDVLSSEWLGLKWIDAASILGSDRVGVYRAAFDGAVVYVGQGRLRSRIQAHEKKAKIADHRQAHLFGPEVAWSCVDLTGMSTVQLLELENDLIASHVLSVGHAPRAQFLG